MRHSLPFTLGGGVMGIVPYAEGYMQLVQGERPAGIGARFGLSSLGTNPMGQVYARLDLPIAGGRHLLWNPALFHASGSTAAASASVTALVNGVGLEGGGDDTFTPSLAFVIARAQHDFPPIREGPGQTRFIVAGLRVAFGGHESARAPR